MSFLETFLSIVTPLAVLTYVACAGQNGEDNAAPDKPLETLGRCNSKQEQANADFGQAQSNEAERLGDKVQMKPFADVRLGFDVLVMAAGTELDLWNDYHHFSEHDSLLTE
jgi:hypothetical protein